MTKQPEGVAQGLAVGVYEAGTVAPEEEEEEEEGRGVAPGEDRARVLARVPAAVAEARAASCHPRVL